MESNTIFDLVGLGALLGGLLTAVVYVFIVLNILKISDNTTKILKLLQKEVEKQNTPK